MLIPLLFAAQACGGSSGGNVSYSSIEDLVNDFNQASDLCKEFETNNNSDMLLPPTKEQGDCNPDGTLGVYLFADEKQADAAERTITNFQCNTLGGSTIARGGNWLVFETNGVDFDADSLAEASEGRVIRPSC